MPGGGSLTFATSALEVSDTHPAADEELPHGSYVALAITDTGTGMPPEIAARVFEPFFTTKTGGAGTGLGLSMVYGFAKQSGGSVTIESQPGRGTTVTLFLPTTGKASPLADATGGAASPHGTPRTVLVVEDEDNVRTSVKRQLESLGHRVLVAGAAAEALILLGAPGAPDILLTDVVLGSGMDGIELADAAHVERPRLPVIFMSGYTAVPEAQQRIRETGAPLLAKPFTTPELERAINEVCAARESS
jgi:CheY-like chemotaxis protein